MCEVQSDKATIEITSPYAGIVTSLKHPVGGTVPVGDILAIIQQPGNATSSTEANNDTNIFPESSSNFAASSITHIDPTAAAAAAAAGGGGGKGGSFSIHENIQTSPAVRRLAQEMNINLSAISGSGPGGRIIKSDVINAAESAQGGQQQHSQPETPAGASSYETAPSVQSGGYSKDTYSPYGPTEGSIPRAAHAVRAAAGAAAPAGSFGAPPPSPPKEPLIIPLRGYRKAMFKAMTNVANIPHFHYCDEVSTDALVELRAKLQGAPVLKGQKLTFLPFLIKAAALALKENPMINSSVSSDGTALVQHPNINIGIAVATDLGLVVPNIKNVDQHSIASIVGELKRLQTAAMLNQLKPDDVAGGTFTISNIGTMGGTYATPLVNVPEVAIMALGKIQTLPRFAPDGVTVKSTPVLSVSLGADHRVIDGATLASFGTYWKSLVEDPGRLLLELK